MRTPNQQYMQSLAGISAPLGFFDPLSLSKNCKTISSVKLLREAELMHGRVAMMAVVGFFFGEKLPLLNNFFEEDVVGPAVNHWQQAPAAPLIALSLITGITEFIRADKGWVEPNKARWTIRDEYLPGDLGFDPLGLKPDTPDSLKLMQTRELNNGRYIHSHTRRDAKYYHYATHPQRSVGCMGQGGLELRIHSLLRVISCSFSHENRLAMFAIMGLMTQEELFGAQF